MENLKPEGEEAAPLLSLWTVKPEEKKKATKNFIYYLKKIPFYFYDFFLLPCIFYKFPFFIIFLLIYKSKILAFAKYSVFTSGQIAIRLNVLFAAVIWCLLTLKIYILWTK